MRGMIVIADDITGAAEIAGIAFEKGRQVRLLCSTSVCGDTIAAEETVVIATDTRSMTEEDAAAEIRRQTSHLSPLFKKTDSALRGHVVAELTALMETTGFKRVVYLPANPSKGRIIRDGIYYINGVPIHETDFSFDPEFPAWTSSLRERFPDAEAHNIVMPDAETTEDIRRVVDKYDDGLTLFAGAADLFTEVLASYTSNRSRALVRDVTKCPDPNVTLILCGSTQSKPLDVGIPISPMPKEIYDGSTDITLWDTRDYEKYHKLILTIPYTHRTGKEAATHLRQVMAMMAKRLVDIRKPDRLIIEGGATAWATLKVLGWTQFSIVSQHAPGVVTMKAANGPLVTLKPGSYPWGFMSHRGQDTL